MKRLIGLIVLSVVLLSAQAQNDNVIKITGTKFPFDIMQKWIQEYSKTHAGIRFELSKAIYADSADLYIQAHGFRDGELKNNQTIVAVNRYIQLPIVNSQRKDLKALQSKGFTKKDLQDVYFSNGKKDEFAQATNVYKRDKNVCASRSFAENVTGIQSDVYGTLVKGDDRALFAAVKNDVDGISYNNLGFIYNLRTRKIVDSLAIVPIDINENGKIDADENIYAILDDVLTYAGKENSAHLPQDNVNVVLNKTTINKIAVDFLNWVITKGQSYNRAYGFLNLVTSVVKQEQQLLAGLIKKDSSVASKQ